MIKLINITNNREELLDIFHAEFSLLMTKKEDAVMFLKCM